MIIFTVFTKKIQLKGTNMATRLKSIIMTFREEAPFSNEHRAREMNHYILKTWTNFEFPARGKVETTTTIYQV